MRYIRAPFLAALLLALALAASGCSSTHTQALTPSSPLVSSPSTNPSSSGMTSPKNSLAPLPTPTVVPVAQKAVDAYIALAQALDEASVDPAKVDLNKINAYLAESAQPAVDQQFAQMKKGGIAYRGTPDDPRLKVVGVSSPTAILLSSCPLASPTHPFVQYYVATGKPVATTTLTPPPPFKKVITMTSVNGSWRLSELASDTSKTCIA